MSDHRLYVPFAPSVRKELQELATRTNRSIGRMAAALVEFALAHDNVAGELDAVLSRNPRPDRVRKSSQVSQGKRTRTR